MLPFLAPALVRPFWVSVAEVPTAPLMRENRYAIIWLIFIRQAAFARLRSLEVICAGSFYCLW
jgi:hypothetical protein